MKRSSQSIVLSATCLMLAGLAPCVQVSAQSETPDSDNEKAAVVAQEKQGSDKQDETAKPIDPAAKAESIAAKVEEKKALSPDQQKSQLKTLAAASKEADSAGDFSGVIQQCEEQLDEFAYLSANEKYIRSLIAWSLNRRGELRMELGFEFDRVGNTSEADAAFEKAKADFERAIGEDETQWKAFLNRGIVRSHYKDWNKAIRDFQVSVKLRPTQTFAYFNLAEIEYQRQHFKASLAYYDQILKSSENDTQALNGRALALAGQQRFEEALAIYEDLIEADAENAQLLTNRGDIYQTMGRWSDAEQTYVEALKIQQSPSIYRRLAWLFATCPDASIRQSDGAIVMAKKSISISRKTSAAQWDALGAAMAANGDFHGAMDCMKKALELEPKNEDFMQRQELYGQSQTYTQVPKVAKSDSELLDR